MIVLCSQLSFFLIILILSYQSFFNFELNIQKYINVLLLSFVTVLKFIYKVLDFCIPVYFEPLACPDSGSWVKSLRGKSLIISKIPNYKSLNNLIFFLQILLFLASFHILIEFLVFIKSQGLIDVHLKEWTYYKISLLTLPCPSLADFWDG